MRIFLSIVVLAATLAGCAIPPPVPDRAVQGELVRLKRDQEDLSQQLQRLQDNLLLVEARVQDQEQLIAELQKPLAAQKVTTAGEKAGPAEPTAAAATAVSGQTAQTLSPTAIYLQAFADYASGRFQRAILGFESFLSLYPNSDYAGNAQYWLGECFYSQQQYGRAAAEFRKVVDHYPQGGKTPDALLKMAAALLQMDQGEQAGEALQILQERYPDSPAAKKALESDPFPKNLQE